MSKRIAKKIFSRKDVLEAAKIWDNAPGLRGFKVGTRYEVRIKDKAYPPKAIASIANELSTGEVLFPKDFPGALDGKWHQALAAASPGFKPVSKNGSQRIKGTGVKRKSCEAVEVIDEDQSFSEGAERKAFKLHTERERDSKVIRLAKNLAKQLSCEACGFDFGKFYGERGEGYIEGHHTKPIAEMKPRGEETIVKDIALVCSNCHRMLHRMRPLITIDELKQRINEQRVKSLK
jgi:hypothetical protein